MKALNLKPYEAPFYAGADVLFALNIQRREHYDTEAGLAQRLQQECDYEAGRAEWTADQVFNILDELNEQ